MKNAVVDTAEGFKIELRAESEAESLFRIEGSSYLFICY